MATLIPALSSCGNMTGGERRFAQRLEHKLEDDYLCWYNVPVGARRLHPDFIVLHPCRGILVLEVKDWRLENIQSMTRTSAGILTQRGLVKAPNPLEQARQYAQALASLLQQDPNFIAPAGHRHQGNLLFPWGYGAVLSNITRKAFEGTDLPLVLDPDRVICKDEMTESVDAEDFQKRLWQMFTVYFEHTLTLPQIDRIRWIIFPEVRINQGQLTLDENVSAAEALTETIPDLIRVMDLQQEQLARSLGEGHRVVHGVAGSGKTMILGYRCAHLAQLSSKPILVLCYNVSLAAWLEAFIQRKGLTAKVRVRNFHQWCAEQLRTYHVARPAEGNAYFDQLVQRVIDAVDRRQIPAGQYGAVMIDEGHDFRPEWLKLVVQMVDPKTQSLLVLYDDAQSIYKDKRRPFSFASVGVQAQGRTTILRLNYRNTAEILAVAGAFAKEVFADQDTTPDAMPLIKPDTAGRRGPVPQLIRLPSFSREIEHLGKQLKHFNAGGVPWEDIAVIYRRKSFGSYIAGQLREAGIPVTWLHETRESRRYRHADRTVKVMTMHSSKGLEFPVVAIPGVGLPLREQDDSHDEARLMYVAMTRATDRLIMTSHADSDFCRLIGDAIRECDGQPELISAAS